MTRDQAAIDHDALVFTNHPVTPPDESTEWRDDGWVVVSRWYTSTLASHWEQPLKKSQVYEVSDEDAEGWLFQGDGQRVTVEASEDGLSFVERWEVRDEDGSWHRLCDVCGSRESR